MNRLAAVLCCVLVALAGCAGGPSPASTDQATTTTVSGTPTGGSTTPTDAGARETTGREAGGVEPTAVVDEARVFERVTELLGVDAERPRVTWTRRERGGGLFVPESGFAVAVGVEVADVDAPHSVAGYTAGADDVRIFYGANASAGALRQVLVHEYVHAIQRQTPAYEHLATDPDVRPGAVARAVTEGAATYATTAYAERYGGFDATQRRLCADYESGAAAAKLRLGPYCEGAQYVDWRVDSPANLSTVYRDPPTTTEQVRHNRTAAAEPPRPLGVRALASDRWTPTRGEAGATRRGELWTYAVLTASLDEARADRAATGWGNDVLVRYDWAYDPGWAWVTRWDSPGDADEFQDAMAAHAANASGRVGPRFDVEVRRVNETVVAVVAGPRVFVSGTTFDVEAGTVVVTPPRSNASVATAQSGATATSTPLAARASRT